MRAALEGRGRRAGLRRQGPQPLHRQGLRRLRDVRRLEDRAERRQRHLSARHAAGADLGPAKPLRKKSAPAASTTTRRTPPSRSKIADKPIGQWNTFYIKMVGDKVTVKLNGELVVDNVVLENYWERDKPIYPDRPDRAAEPRQHAVVQEHLSPRTAGGIVQQCPLWLRLRRTRCQRRCMSGQGRHAERMISEFNGWPVCALVNASPVMSP